MRTSLQRMLTAFLTTLSMTALSNASVADDLLITGTIYTANDDLPIVEAVVVSNGRFTYVGSLKGARLAASEQVKEIELDSRIAYPGFIESHGHLSSLGESITNLDLNGVDSYQTIVGMVADAAAKAAPGQVIKGRGWHQSKWQSQPKICLLYTSPSPRDRSLSRMPSSA